MNEEMSRRIARLLQNSHTSRHCERVFIIERSNLFVVQETEIATSLCDNLELLAMTHQRVFATVSLFRDG